MRKDDSHDNIISFGTVDSRESDRIRYSPADFTASQDAKYPSNFTKRQMLLYETCPGVTLEQFYKAFAPHVNNDTKLHKPLTSYRTIYDGPCYCQMHY